MIYLMIAVCVILVVIAYVAYIVEHNTLIPCQKKCVEPVKIDEPKTDGDV